MVGDSEIFRRAAAAIRALGPWPEDQAVALAFSGGADSVFLARGWLEFAAAGGPRVRGWVVDHGNRPGSGEDARRAAALLEGLGIAGRILTAETERPVTEDRLRRARYAAFKTAATQEGVGVVLTAHQADDLAETVLMRILRGTGLRGLAGIPARRVPEDGLASPEFRRPLLGFRRAEIRAALREAKEPWVEDPTNADPGFAVRNRIRREVLPMLGKVATGDPVRALLRLAAEADEWRSALGELLADAGPWRELPGYLRRQAVAAAIREAGRTVSPARLRDLEGALLARGSAGVDEGLRLSVSGGRLHPVALAASDAT